MKLAYLMLWLAGGGLIALETYVFWKFLRVREARHQAEAQELWEILVREKSV